MPAVRHLRIDSIEVVPDRLDTGYYSYDYFSAKNRLQGSGIPFVEIGAVCEPWCFGAYALCNDIEWCTKEEGIPYVKAEALGAPLLNDSGLSYITPSTHMLLAKSQLTAGDIIVSTSGTVGMCAVIPEYIQEINSNQDTIKFCPPKERFDPYFVVAWISTPTAQAILDRESGGAVQKHIYLHNFQQILLLEPRLVVQQYIGKKVRQAERLRNLVKALSVRVDSLFELGRNMQYLVGQKKSYWSISTLIQSDRLDASFYDPAHIHLSELLKEQQATELGTHCQLCNTRWIRTEREFYYLEIGALDIDTSRIKARLLPVSDAPSRAQRLVQPWDILVATVRPNRKNIAIVPNMGDNLPIVASTGFSVLRFENKEVAAFYHAWLRCDVATQQLIQWNAGGTYPAIEEEIPLRIRVPKFSEQLVNRIGSQLVLGFEIGELAERLVVAAKLLVEALIEGKITEDEIAMAQAQLEQGDSAGDRLILSRLYDGGIDAIEGKRLFEDLDAFYELLLEAEAGPTNSEWT